MKQTRREYFLIRNEFFTDIFFRKNANDLIVLVFFSK